MNVCNKLKYLSLVSGKYFLPIIMFVGKARAYPSEAPKVLSSRIDSRP